MSQPVAIVPVLRTHELDDAAIGVVCVMIGDHELTFELVRNGPMISMDALRTDPRPPGAPVTVIDTATGEALQMAGGGGGGGGDQQRYRFAFRFTSRPEQIAVLGPDEQPLETIELTPAPPIDDPATYAEASGLDVGPSTLTLISEHRHQFLPRSIDPIAGSRFDIREATAQAVLVEHYDGHFVVVFRAEGVMSLEPLAGLERISLDGVSTGVPTGATGRGEQTWVRVVFPGEFGGGS